jgi:hypothetical protein
MVSARNDNRNDGLADDPELLTELLAAKAISMSEGKALSAGLTVQAGFKEERRFRGYVFGQARSPFF